MSDTPLIRLADVTKRFSRGAETITIFDGLNLTMDAGEFVAVMGPSGSGKSTLLNLLGGIDGVNSGTVTVGDDLVSDMNQSQLSRWRAQNVGFIFQFYNLMPTLAAAKNVELPLMLTKLSAKERRQRVSTALDIVGLSDRAKHKPRELSGGQQQRVAIARAIVADPKLILADEPTGDLDRATADEILEMLKVLKGELGKTIVMVTHDPEAASHADRELHLNKGQFVEAERAA